MPSQPLSAEQAEWERRCPRALTADPLWSLDVYRSALFLLHLAVKDARPFTTHRSYQGIAAQLMEAVGSIGSHIAEGYSRATRVGRLRFLGYALGPVRESV